jgi:hypothetical protein
MLTLIAVLFASFQTFSLHAFQPATKAVMQPDDIVFAVFVGRTPCREIADELKLAAPSDCFKMKWKITFYHDAVNNRPTTYTIDRTMARDQLLRGKWQVLKGTAADADAVVYQLTPEKGDEPMYFLKADDNILFFLNKQRVLLAGNEQFSYTLNRVIP